MCNKHYQAWHYGSLVGVEPEAPRVRLVGAPMVSARCYQQLARRVEPGVTIGDLAGEILADAAKLRPRATRGGDGATPQVRLTGLPHFLPADLHQRISRLCRSGEAEMDVVVRVLEAWAREA
jgi:hypothetical protein